MKFIDACSRIARTWPLVEITVHQYERNLSIDNRDSGRKVTEEPYYCLGEEKQFCLIVIQLSMLVVAQTSISLVHSSMIERALVFCLMEQTLTKFS